MMLARNRSISYSRGRFALTLGHRPVTGLAVTPKSILAVLLSLACIFSLIIDLPGLAASGLPKDKNLKQDSVLKGLPITELSADEAILHALNRLAYGPRPGDIERIRQMGLAKWIDLQLNPKALDDSAMEARLSAFPTLQMSTAQLLAEYPNPKQAANQAAKQPGVAKEDTNQQQALQKDADAGVNAMVQDMPASDSATKGQAGAGGSEDAASTDTPSPMKLNSATPGADRKDALGVDPNAVPRALADDSNKPRRVVEELAMAKVTRAIYSERQLQQVMDDFWFNHFNVYAGKGEDKWYLTSYERDVIQPHALGKFKDLLTETAKSPAMLFCLDNFLSADPRAAARQAAERAMRQQMRRGPYGGWGSPNPPAGQGANNKKKQERGLNENYGRELMELHTLGVDGGYTQQDVTEVARCFTGWTIEKPRENPRFKFDERVHDPDPKRVLGKKIHAGGMKDGEQVIDLLVKNPNTAKFISTKLARRFVSDTPPPALIQRMAKTFQKSDGDIREVLRTMIYSPEFWSRGAYRAKVKKPFELVVSSVRALGTDVDTPMPLVQWVGRIGEPLYQCQPPTGYSDKAETWVNTGALLNRLNFSLALAGNKVRGSRSDVAALLGSDSSSDAKAALDRAVAIFLGGQAASGTVETLQKQLDNPQIVQAKLDDPVKQVDLGVVTGLVLGAPEFQRR
ncbi:MAG TPA: DUF1800 family protein [Candidatus Acidoferrum sp.]|nr:DUF1800 family protein [Candidatus Acidoferrum sp.]